jgi:REP element-mobilizing transposase RayT
MTLYRGKYRIETTRYRWRDYRSRGAYFVTICSHDKKHIFGEVENDEVHLLPIGRIADRELRTLGSHYANVSVDSHVVMPNHVHAIIVIDGDHQFAPNPVALSPLGGISPAAGSLGAIVRSYKAGVTRRCHELGFPRGIWQPRFYDRIIRGDANISAVREYICNNPANWSHDPDFL